MCAHRLRGRNHPSSDCWLSVFRILSGRGGDYEPRLRHKQVRITKTPGYPVFYDKVDTNYNHLLSLVKGLPGGIYGFNKVGDWGKTMRQYRIVFPQVVLFPRLGGARCGVVSHSPWLSDFVKALGGVSFANSFNLLAGQLMI